MKGYKHLTEFDRNKIARMRKEGATMREIGAALHVSAATVCREIKRGTYTYMNADYIEVTEYIPERSQARYRANMAAKGGPLKIGSDRRYAETLEALIADDNYSPEAALHEIENHPDIDGIMDAISQGSLEGVTARMANVLEDVTIRDYPVIAEIKQHMIENGALNALMSGSGPTVFGIFDDRRKAEHAYQKLQDTNLVKQIYLTKPFGHNHSVAVGL
mgnify:CR=1 FL=1